MLTVTLMFVQRKSQMGQFGKLRFFAGSVPGLGNVAMLVNRLQREFGRLLGMKGKVFPESSRRFRLARHGEMSFGTDQPVQSGSRSGLIQRHGTTPCPR